MVLASALRARYDAVSPTRPLISQSPEQYKSRNEKRLPYFLGNRLSNVAGNDPARVPAEYLDHQVQWQCALSAPLKIWKILTVLAFLGAMELAILPPVTNAALVGAAAGLFYGLMTAGANRMAGRHSEFQWRVVAFWIIGCTVLTFLGGILRDI